MRLRNRLTEAAIRDAKPAEKFYRLYDGDSLYLEVSPSGSKLWRFRYRFDGKQKLLAMGQYPAISLDVARASRDEARKQVKDGVDLR